ncbi:hypothetical protein F4808DRAFT_251282 [Astrocystis sublimbata]|nr:hypothetical protein F4808DRAFT_251282 [Astrocystis sublimbata]
MPPKRKSTGSEPAGKKAKASGSAAAASSSSSSSSSSKPAVLDYKPPRSARWEKVSASANLETDYRMVWRDEKKAYRYITLCKAWYAKDYESEEESARGPHAGKYSDPDVEGAGDEYDEDSSKRTAPRCGKENCVCFKAVPAKSNPEHPWVVSWAGFSMFNTLFTHSMLRNPDYFSMYTFNDHAGYGSLEILQNLLLDFEAAAKEGRGDGWREQWAVCECAAHWILHQEGGQFTQIDDGEAVLETLRLIGRMFLAMLAQLDAMSLLGDTTVVKSLGCTMAMYMDLASEFRKTNALDDAPRETTAAKAKKLQPDYFEDAVLAYANKRGITLRGPEDIEDIKAEAEPLAGKIELPAAGAKDPWGFKSELTKYKKTNGGLIGGDKYDVTTMTSAERKAKSFEKKDPIDKKMQDAIKEGLVMTMARAG